MNFEDLDAFCQGFAYALRRGERPDLWEDRGVPSSFAVDLVKLQARLKGSDELLFDFGDVNEDVAPHGEWRSESVSVASLADGLELSTPSCRAPALRPKAP